MTRAPTVPAFYRAMLVFSTAALFMAFAILAQAGAAERSGSFSGASGHSTTGSVTVVDGDGQKTVMLGADFVLDGAPDPWIGFGKDGRFIASTRFIELRRNTGAQTYQVPARIDLGAVNEVYIWCEKFSVPLGVARIR